MIIHKKFPGTDKTQCGLLVSDVTWTGKWSGVTCEACKIRRSDYGDYHSGDYKCKFISTDTPIDPNNVDMGKLKAFWNKRSGDRA